MATHRRLPSSQQAEHCLAGFVNCVRLPTASRPRHRGRRVGDEMSGISQKDKRDEECGNAYRVALAPLDCGDLSPLSFLAAEIRAAPVASPVVCCRQSVRPVREE
jgi:hypothetical protein